MSLLLVATAHSADIARRKAIPNDAQIVQNPNVLPVGPIVYQPFNRVPLPPIKNAQETVETLEAENQPQLTVLPTLPPITNGPMTLQDRSQSVTNQQYQEHDNIDHLLESVQYPNWNYERSDDFMIDDSDFIQDGEDFSLLYTTDDQSMKVPEDNMDIDKEIKAVFDTKQNTKPTDDFKEEKHKITHGEIHYHEHKHLHKHDHKQQHNHEHKQEHKHHHDHKHEAGHKHAHDHKHDHTHKNDHHHHHKHDHNNVHKHDHKHGHKHGHKEGHKHHHDQKHSHDHKHHHGHDHKHDNHHAHDHKHDHKHQHKQEHKHDHGHKHQHGHKHHHEHKGGGH